MRNQNAIEALESMICAYDQANEADETCGRFFGEDNVFARISGHIMDGIGLYLYGTAYASDGVATDLRKIIDSKQIEPRLRAVMVLDKLELEEQLLPRPIFFTEEEKKKMSMVANGYAYVAPKELAGDAK